MQMLSGGGLLAYGLTITFASFDWLMSLEPHWFSTIYGVLIMGGQGLIGAGVPHRRARRGSAAAPPLDAIVVPAHFHDLGNLMLAFVMLWAYFSFSQYLIIWSGNLPEEIAWYLHRLQTGWRFDRRRADRLPFRRAVPAAAVARRQAAAARCWSRSRSASSSSRLIDLFWLIAPGVPSATASSVSWLDVVLPLSLGAIWLGCFSGSCAAAPILPVHDPQFDEALGPIIERGGERRDGALSHGRHALARASTPTSTRDVHHEESDVNIRAIFGFGVGLIVVARRRSRRRLAAVRVSSTAAKRGGLRPQYPLAAGQETALPPEPRLQTNPRAGSARPARARGRRCSTATAGSTRTPASCGSRSTRR